METLQILGGILMVVALIEIKWRPRLGFTTENKILLWYGRRVRKYIFLN